MIKQINLSVYIYKEYNASDKCEINLIGFSLVKCLISMFVQFGSKKFHKVITLNLCKEEEEGIVDTQQYLTRKKN